MLLYVSKQEVNLLPFKISNQKIKMKKDYTFVYKCRLCGETHSSSSIRSEDSGIVLNLLDSFSKMKAVPEIKPFSIHTCKNGNIGISDLQGAIVDELK